MGLLDFLSPEAGQDRRRWLDSQEAALAEALRYYLGPTGIPDRLGAANEMLNPVVGLQRSAAATNRALDPSLGGVDRVAAGADAATEALAALLGGQGLLSAGRAVAPAAERGLIDFIGDESGSVNLGGLYNAVARVTDEDLAAATPFRRTGAENFTPKREGGGRAKDPALYTGFSSVKQDKVAPYDWEVTGRRLGALDVPPEVITPEGIANKFDVMFGYPADATLNNVIIDSVNGVTVPSPIMQQAGHTFPDRPGLGFASEPTAMGSRNKAWREAQREGLRTGVTPMVMGAKGGDFSQHVGQTQAQLMRGAEGQIDPNFMPGKLPPRMTENLTGLLDPRLPYVLEGMNGTERAAFMKALDTSPAMQAGVPSVAATRWATMDPNLIGADLLSSGYRVFEPAPSDVIRRHGGNVHATYGGYVNKVGPSMTMGDPRPWYLMFPDVAYPSMVSATKKGANMLRADALPKDLRKFQMNTKLRQDIDQEWVDVNSRYDEILASQGKEAADLFAYDALINRATRKGL